MENRTINFRIMGIALLTALFFVGCFAKPLEIVINSSSCIINDKGVEFNVKPPVERKYRSGSVMIKLKEDWETLPPFDVIKISDGRLVRVKVEVFTNNGAVYIAKIFGKSGAILNGRFEPEIPKDVSIFKIRLSSDIPLTCLKLVWLDYNPL